MISVSPNIKGDAEPVSRAKWEWCELGQCSGLPGGGDTEADVTASLNRSREQGQTVWGNTGTGGWTDLKEAYKFMRCRQIRKKVRWVVGSFAVLGTTGALSE